MAPSLDLLLLGPPRIEVGGVPISVDTRKATAILAYLAVTGRPQSRDALAGLLWPERDPEHARGALRRTLSVLNTALGGRFLVIDRAAVDLEGGGVRLDVADFRARVSAKDFAAAVRLYRGDFLAGFFLRDSVPYETWQLEEGEALQRDLAGALDGLAQQCIEQGELDQALEHARRRLVLDPLHEAAHRRLIELYALGGRRAQAIEQYRECVRTLDHELGVGPLPETAELYRAILEDRVPRREPAAAEPGAPSGPLPLVGRAGELVELVRAYGSARRSGGLLVIEGEAGIGKTRLAEELEQRARADGAVVIAVGCHEGEAGLAFGVLADALRSVAGVDLAGMPSHGLVEGARIVPQLAEARPGLPAPGPLDAPGARTRFLDGVAELLSTACDVLVIEDVQWADSSSLEALAYLARRLRERPLCLVLTWRGDELRPGHELRSLVADAEHAGGVTRVTLSRLDVRGVSELVRAGVPDAAGDVPTRVHAVTGGVPLFVVEYVGLLASGREPEALPSGLADLLRARVAAPSEPARQLLAAAAVIGRPFDVDAVREASGRGDEETVSGLEELVRRGLLVETAEGYAFVHQIVAELVYDETSLARRRLLHRRVADAHAGGARRGRRELAALAAEHYRLAGREVEAAEHHRVAGLQASSVFANAEALRHFEAALALGHADASGLHEAIGDLHTLRGSYAAAVASYEAAAAHAEPPRLAAIEHRLGLVHHRRGSWELAAAHLEVAARGVTDARFRARLGVDRSLNEHRRKRDDEALALARAALVDAEEAGDRRALAQAHNILGILASSRGDAEEAGSHLERSLALAGAMQDPSARAAALNNLALHAAGSGDSERAVELASAALELVAARGDRHREAALQNNLADILYRAGRREEAMEHLKQAAAIFAEVGADLGEMHPEIWKLSDW